MSYEFYKILHVVGLMMVFSGLGSDFSWRQTLRCWWWCCPSAQGGGTDAWAWFGSHADSGIWTIGKAWYGWRLAELGLWQTAYLAADWSKYCTLCDG